MSEPEPSSFQRRRLLRVAWSQKSSTSQCDIPQIFPAVRPTEHPAVRAGSLLVYHPANLNGVRLFWTFRSKLRWWNESFHGRLLHSMLAFLQLFLMGDTHLRHQCFLWRCNYTVWPPKYRRSSCRVTVILCPMWQLKELEGRIELGASTQSVNLMYSKLFIYLFSIYLFGFESRWFPV